MVFGGMAIDHRNDGKQMRQDKKIEYLARKYYKQTNIPQYNV
jgi:hypothetical protein